MTEVAVTLQERLEAAVEDLNRCQVTEDVAAILRAEQIRGRPGNCHLCPIAVLISRRLDGAEVEVDGAIVAYGPFERAEVPAPAAVEAFIGQVDDHERPEFETDGPCDKIGCARCNPSAVDA